MKLRYTGPDGSPMEYELPEDDSITIGRSPDADIVISDERASRYHCGIRCWDGDYVAKDLKSRNGTYVNEKAIDVCQLCPGDEIRIGSTKIIFEEKLSKGATTIIREVSSEMDGGKGYNTILREIVDSTDDKD